MKASLIAFLPRPCVFASFPKLEQNWNNWNRSNFVPIVPISFQFWGEDQMPRGAKDDTQIREAFHIFQLIIYANFAFFTIFL